jgi:phospholipid/cholesterol/gamma-HCH transport system substrate-binding protein
MSDYDYIQQKRNMIVGAFVIVGVCVFIYMVFLFGELPVVTAKFKSFTIKVMFPYAPGVEADTPVQYCGYQIGKVTNVSPPEQYNDEQGRIIHQVAVEMAISKKYSDIPSNATIKLFRRGMGSSYVEISVPPITTADINALEIKYLKQGMVLQGTRGSGNDLIPEDLQNEIKGFVGKITILVDNLNRVVGDQNNQTNLKKTLANLSKATEESITTLQKIREFSQSGTKTSEELGETLIDLRRILNKINDGQGTVGKLVNDDKLYNNMVDISEELKVAIEKLKKTLDKTSEKGIQVKIF